MRVEPQVGALEVVEDNVMWSRWQSCPPCTEINISSLLWSFDGIWIATVGWSWAARARSVSEGQQTQTMESTFPLSSGALWFVRKSTSACSSAGKVADSPCVCAGSVPNRSWEAPPSSLAFFLKWSAPEWSSLDCVAVERIVGLARCPGLDWGCGQMQANTAGRQRMDENEGCRQGKACVSSILLAQGGSCCTTQYLKAGAFTNPR